MPVSIHEVDYLAREELPALEGGTIIRAGAANDGEFLVPMIVVECRDGSRQELLIYQDAEGNGPGWIHMMGIGE